MLMIGVEIKTIGQIMAHLIVMIMTGTVMTDIITSTLADTMTGVTTGGTTTEVDTSLHIGILLIDLQTILGLMTTVEMT